MKPLLAALLGCTLLAACQSRMPAPPEQAGSDRQVPEVPFVPQDAYQCGPAALATMLGWSGLATGAGKLVDEVWLPQQRGSLAMELAAAARQRHRLVYPIDSPDELFAALDADQPVLVMQNLALAWLPRWHFAVVTGYRNGGRQLVLNSGTREARTLHWNRFVRTWARADFQGWLVLPPGELPARTEPLMLVQALEDLRGTAGAEATAPFWKTAAERHAGDYLVQFGHGNHLWEAGDRQAAADAFRAATRARPEAWPAWHNLILALHESGCREQATETLREAVENSHSPEIDRLRRRLRTTPETSCDLAPKAG